MTRRLLIVDRYDAPALERLARNPGAADWDVLLLGRTNAWFEWRYPSPKPRPWRLVDPAPFATAAADRVGAFLVDLVARLPGMPLGGTTLHELLASPGGSLWWFLEITEKGPFRGPLVGQLYRAALAALAAERQPYAEVRVSLAERALAESFTRAAAAGAPFTVEEAPAAPLARWYEARPALRYWLHAVAAVARNLAVKVWVAVWGDGTQSTTGGLTAFTFFPAWWTKPFSPHASDRFFSHLGEAGVHYYLTWVSTAGPLWRHPKAARQVMRARGMAILQADVWARDLAGLLSPGRFARVRRFEHDMRPLLSARFGDLDVGPLVASEVSRSLTGGEFTLSTLLARATARRAARLRPAAVLYRIEFQPFENALLRGLRGLSHAIGFLHYPFGRHYLATRFAPGEVRRYLAATDPARDRPLPDGIIACGETGIEHATASGYPRRRCTPCGPQRFGRLLEYRRGYDTRENARRRLALPLDLPVYFVTLAITEDDTEALFGALVEALGHSAGYRLVVRAHPNRPEGDPSLRSALAALGSDRASLMDPHHDLYDVMRAADAIVCIGSMIAFEAIALGCMPVVFENSSSFPALSLAEFDEGLFVARNGRELAAALQAIGDHDVTVEAKRTRWPDLLARVLGDLDTPLSAQLARALSKQEIPPS